LNKAVKRNIDRFPEDIMFQLTNEEFGNLKFHFGTSSWGGTRKLPYAFAENGVAMLSSVLNSKLAIQERGRRTHYEFRVFCCHFSRFTVFKNSRELNCRQDRDY
jgi:hypothetical protein